MYRVLHANDSPHRIAMGMALGLFVAWTPAYGLHILIVLPLAFLFRANKFLALTCIWVTNPFTLAFIYYPNYLLGKKIFDVFHLHSNPDSARLNENFAQFNSSIGLTGIFHAQFWKNLFEVVWLKGSELWLGSLVIGITIAVCAYFIIQYLVVRHRKAGGHRRFRIQQQD